MGEVKSIIEFFAKIPDPRRGAGQRHEQTFVLLLILMSTMSGYIGYRAIGDFITRNKVALLEHLQPKKNRLPSFYTVRRVIQGIDFSLVSKQFYRWASQYVTLSKEEWVSIDGKVIGGTVTNANSSNQQFVSLVSLYCSKQKLILGNEKVLHKKENEITVVQQLIQALELQGVTFTLDALHCQKKTTEIIINGKNEYVIGVKKNQPGLYNKIETIMADKNKRSSWYSEIEINKGRTELRSITVSDNVEGISDQWIGLRQLVSIQRMVNTKGNKTEETAYFISSKRSNAFNYNEGIRLHWAIENSLHYVKDVTLKEDASKIRTGYAPQNISTIKNISINIFRTNKYKNMSQAMRLIANDIPLIKSMIT